MKANNIYMSPDCIVGSIFSNSFLCTSDYGEEGAPGKSWTLTDPDVFEYEL